MRLLFSFLLSLCIIPVYAQTSFSEVQQEFPRVAHALRAKEDSLIKQFDRAGLQWPPNQIFVRSFKYDSQLEIWVRENSRQDWKLFKTFRVCAMAGQLGPKRMEGDYQVPEGFYLINEFNPRSSFHLSLGLNYPNASDRILSDSLRPGGEIYIHGKCVTTGCIPIQDNQIEEVYVLAMHAKNAGQDYIPVHVYPVRYNMGRSVAFLEKASKDDPSLKPFNLRLKEAFDYFEKNKQLPTILINKRGEYVLGK